MENCFKISRANDLSFRFTDTYLYLPAELSLHPLSQLLQAAQVTNIMTIVQNCKKNIKNNRGSKSDFPSLVGSGLAHFSVFQILIDKKISRMSINVLQIRLQHILTLLLGKN